VTSPPSKLDEVEVFELSLGSGGVDASVGIVVNGGVKVLGITDDLLLIGLVNLLEDLDLVQLGLSGTLVLGLFISIVIPDDLEVGTDVAELDLA